MAGKVRSYISAGLLSRLYSEGFSRPPAEEAAPEPPPPPKSEHEQVVDELHLTPNLTSTDLKLIRRKFAKTNHPDRVAASRARSGDPAHDHRQFADRRGPAGRQAAPALGAARQQPHAAPGQLMVNAA